MSEQAFHRVLLAIAAGFTVLFVMLVVPPLVAHPDVLGAFAAGFENPYASGYSSDVIACWLVLATWVVFEARALQIRGGWLCLALGVVPGVAVGFAVYLVLRSRQLSARERRPMRAPSAGGYSGR